MLYTEIKKKIEKRKLYKNGVEIDGQDREDFAKSDKVKSFIEKQLCINLTNNNAKTDVNSNNQTTNYNSSNQQVSNDKATSNDNEQNTNNENKETENSGKEK